MAVFRGPSKEATAHMAIEAGWRMVKITKGADVRHEFVCPTCPHSEAPPPIEVSPKMADSFKAMGMPNIPSGIAKADAEMRRALVCQYCGGEVKRGDHGTDPHCLACGLRPGEKVPGCKA